MRCNARGLLVNFVIALSLQALLVVMGPGAQAADILDLMRRIGELSKADRYADAVPLGQQLVAETARLAGDDHPMTAIAIFTLADLYRLQGQLDEAEPMLLRVLAIREKAFGPEHREVAQVLASLSHVAIDRAQYPLAEHFLQRAKTIREREFGSDHPDTIMTVVGIARVRHRQARHGEAEALFQQALDGFRKSRGAEHASVAMVLNNLAEVHKEQGQLAAAEGRLREALRIQQQALGAGSVAAAAIANNLGALHVQQGRYAEAEILYRSTLQISEKALGTEHPDVANQLSNLASLFTYQGRAGEAEGLLRRALAITEKAFGTEHPDVANRCNNLAHAISAQGASAEAEVLYRRSLAIREAHFGVDNPSVATALDNLAALLHQQSRFAEAEPLARRSLAIREQGLGATHPLVGNSLNNLAGILHGLRRHQEAGPLLQRALLLREAALGGGHPAVAVSAHNLASHHLDLQDWGAAYAGFKRATAIWISRRKAGAIAPALAQGSELHNNSDPFLGLIVAAYHAADNGRDGAASRLRAEAFESAQWIVGASITSAITRMSARVASADDRLAELVRERQDLAEQLGASDRALIAAAAQPGQMRNLTMEAALLAQAAANNTRLAQLDGILAAEFPRYATLSVSATLPLADAANLLRADEALLLYVPTRDHTYLWVVSRSQVHWVKLPLSSKALGDHIKALRCGLDFEGAWQRDGGQNCRELLRSAEPPGDAGALPFDLARAHELYRLLFAPIAHLVSGKHILVVASGPLTSLPLHVLVASPPADDLAAGQSQYARADWLLRHVAITVLPSVASLKALRQFARQSRASAPFVGFGNPLLLGADGSDRRAWAVQSCAVKHSAALAGSEAGPAPRPPPLRRGGLLADVDVLREQAPLPETADEICTVARLLGASEDSVYLGERATESKLKALSAQGDLKRARILHFATHGLLPDESEFGAEPALLLTPPQQASEDDDGLLTASEVAQLRLDADWVVLSACNTAAGDQVRSQSLSGLARAFFYAGSRALLVSHWYVDSHAAVALTTGAFAALKADPSSGRAEALRQAMLALIDKGDRAHPAYWAPFVVVGEGGAWHATPHAPPIASRPGTSNLSLANKQREQARAKLRLQQPQATDWRSDLWRQ